MVRGRRLCGRINDIMKILWRVGEDQQYLTVHVAAVKIFWMQLSLEIDVEPLRKICHTYRSTE
jgi:hypothetical protein